MMERVESLTVQTVDGPQTVAYEGAQGSKVWTWRDAAGVVVATQPSVAAMVAHKRSVTL